MDARLSSLNNAADSQRQRQNVQFRNRSDDGIYLSLGYIRGMEKPFVYRCGSCDRLVMMSEEVSGSECCGNGLERVEEGAVETTVKNPEADDVLRDIFGLGETTLNICFCVIDQEGATVTEVAEEMDMDRSAVSRHMNRLVEAGILIQNERNLKQGGVVHVYTHEDPEKVKRKLSLGAYFWTAKVIVLIDELNDKKMEAMMDSDVDVAEALGGRIWKDA